MAEHLVNGNTIINPGLIPSVPTPTSQLLHWVELPCLETEIELEPWA